MLPSERGHKSNTAGGSPAITVKRPAKRASQLANGADSAQPPFVNTEPTTVLLKHWRAVGTAVLTRIVRHSLVLRTADEPKPYVHSPTNHTLLLLFARYIVNTTSP